VDGAFSEMNDFGNDETRSMTTMTSDKVTINLSMTMTASVKVTSLAGGSDNSKVQAARISASLQHTA